MPPRRRVELEEVAKKVEEMEMMLSCLSLEKKQRDMQLRLRTARSFLEKVSGGNVLHFLIEVLTSDDHMELWKCLSGRLPGVINAMDIKERRAIVGALSSDGPNGERAWSRKQFALVDITVGDTLWSNRHDAAEPSKGRRPTIVTTDDIEQIEEDHMDNSKPSSRLLKQESKIRGEDVCAQHMLCSFKEVYEGSPLKDKMSHRTYARHRGKEFRRASKRTDVCNICCEGNKTRQRLGEYIARNKKYLTSAHWKATTDPDYLLIHLGETAIPQGVRQALRPMLEELAEVGHHKDEAMQQKKAYKKHLEAPPPDTVVVTIDYKQKGKLPLMPEEPSTLFYNQGTFSWLGFGLHWQEELDVKRHHIDVLLRSTNQDAFVTTTCFDRVLALPVFPKDRSLIIWADSGRHFRCAESLSHWLQHPRVVSVNFFEGGHGKSDRDTHFGVVSRKILEISSKKEIKHLTDVQRALETINNTTAIQVRLLPMKVTKTVLKLPDLTSVSSFEKNKNTITQHAFTGSFGYELKQSAHKKAISFTPRVSEKLPRPESDTDDIVVINSGNESAASSGVEGTFLERLRRKRFRKTMVFETLKENASKKCGQKRKRASASQKVVAFQRRCTSCQEPGHRRDKCPNKSSSCSESSSETTTEESKSDH